MKSLCHLQTILALPLIEQCYLKLLMAPTLYYVSWGSLAPSLGFITDPLLTALSPDFDPAWALAPHPRRLGLCAQ